MGSDTFSPYYESTAFQEFATASREKDFTRLARILEEQLAVTTGREKAFWLLLRYERRSKSYRSPRELRTLWAEFDTLLAIDPTDPEVLRPVVMKALLLYWDSEHNDGLAAMMPVLRPFRHQFLPDHLLRQVLGGLALRRRQWRSAYRHFTLAIRDFQRLSGAQIKAQEGSMPHQFAQRAQAAVALGWLDKAERSVEEARAYLEQLPRRPGINFPLALAEAGLAHARGQYQEARSILHAAEADPQMLRPIYGDVDFLLMAARIARSEGNMSSFDHFCQKAQALCTEYDMPLTAASVQAVMNGAEY
jgi:tetratricopeptide (TPR) repeat protein